MKGDGPPDGIMLTFIDPANAAPESFAKFAARLEATETVKPGCGIFIGESIEDAKGGTT